LLPISQRRRAHRTKAIELLSDNLVRTMTLKCYGWRRVHTLLSRLSLLRREGLLKGVHLLLFPNIDLVFRRGGIHVIQFPFVLHGGDAVLGWSIHCLLLLESGDRYDLETRLREQNLLLGHGRLAGAGSLACCYQRQCCNGTGDIC